MRCFEKLNLPIHRFILWLAIQQKLQTTARLAAIGISSNANCLICAIELEVHQYLFFRCSLIYNCLANNKTWLGIQATTEDLQHLINWVRNTRKSKFQKNVILAGITALVYSIWQARNKVYQTSVLLISVMCISRLKVL